jgi:hypothetical protein
MKAVKFIGKKEVLASPMTRAEYNKYRGWKLPEDENGKDEGFLIEYVEGGDGNHPDHKGYISWSPKKVFVKAYKIAESFGDRVKLEYSELLEKHTKLTKALKDKKVPKKEVEILTLQLSAMKGYLIILKKRLSYIK